MKVDPVKRPLHLDATLYALSALFAGATAFWTVLASHEHWGAIAVGGYAPAAVITVMLLMTAAVPVRTRVLVAGSTAVAVALFPLLVQVIQRAHGNNERAQEEVIVIEDSAKRFWDTGSPYLHESTIQNMADPFLGYNPYQPGMIIFGLPRAIFGDYWWTDSRIYCALVAAACAWAIIRLLRGRSSKGTLLRAFQLSFIVPIAALTVTTSGGDVAVVMLAALAIALAYRGKWRKSALVIGAAAALKLVAWPLIIVVAVFAYQRRQCVRFTAIAVFPAIASLVPFFFIDYEGLVTNVIAFPLGNGLIESPAQSPLPGYLIANYVPYGNTIAIVLLLAAGAAIGVSLYKWPPLTAHATATWCAAGLTIATMLMPATRFGYFLYPVVLLGWALALKSAEDPESELVELFR